MPVTGQQSAQDKLSHLIGGVENLPTPPVVFTQIQKVINNPNTSAYDIASIIQEDPAMSAKVLRLTNSAYYGLSRPVESVKQSVVIVGLDAIKNLVLSASLFTAFAQKQINPEFQDSFWRHSLATAFAARLLALKSKSQCPFDPEGGFSSGLLHDIGKMVIAVYLPEEWRKIEEMKSAGPRRTDQTLEEAVLGYTHMQVGALLAEQWKLPEKIVEAIRYHHTPHLSQFPENTLPSLTHIANYLSWITFDADPESGDISIFEPLHESSLAQSALNVETVRSYIPLLREEYFKSEIFLKMARGAA